MWQTNISEGTCERRRDENNVLGYSTAATGKFFYRRGASADFLWEKRTPFAISLCYALPSDWTVNMNCRKVTIPPIS